MASSRVLIGGILAVTALGSGVLLAAEESPTEVVLRYRFQPGQSLRLRNSTNSVMKLNGGALGFTTNLRSEISLVEKVLDLNGEIATLVTRTEEAKATGTGFGDEKGGFGSSYKDGKLSGYTIIGGKKSPIEASGEWVANRFARVGASGERHAYEGKAPTSRDDYWRPMFPEKAVKAGDTWKTQARFAAPAAAAPNPPTPQAPGETPMFAPTAAQGDVELSLTHTLLKVRGREPKRVATIHTVGTRRELKTAAGHSTTVVDATTEFDVDQGVILSGKSRAETEGETHQQTPAPDVAQPPLVLTITSRQTDESVVKLIEAKSRN